MITCMRMVYRRSLGKSDHSIFAMFYRSIVKPLLFQIPPEQVHRMALPFGKTIGAQVLGRTLLEAVWGYHAEDAMVVVDGVRYHTPVVLSAGFDPNGVLTQTLSSLGFGGEEVGSVTARPCAGNPQPNQIRLPHTKSLVVNKGLRNEGVVAVAARLAKARRTPGFAVGVSVARTNDTESCELASGIEDYAASVAHLLEKNVGDWLTINISCPNTYTGELFLEPENLEKLLVRLAAFPFTKPVYLKMPISVPETQFRTLAEIGAQHTYVRGLIIGNLQKDYVHIDPRDSRPTSYTGGLSGVPCRTDANRLLSLAYEAFGDRFTLIGCGGVFSAEDAMEKFDRGAQLIHLITGMIYEGPGLIGDIARAYAARKNKS